MAWLASYVFDVTQR